VYTPYLWPISPLQCFYRLLIKWLANMMIDKKPFVRHVVNVYCAVIYYKQVAYFVSGLVGLVVLVGWVGQVVLVSTCYSYR